MDPHLGRQDQWNESLIRDITHAMADALKFSELWFFAESNMVSHARTQQPRSSLTDPMLGGTGNAASEFSVRKSWLRCCPDGMARLVLRAWSVQRINFNIVFWYNVEDQSGTRRNCVAHVRTSYLTDETLESQRHPHKLAQVLLAAQQHGALIQQQQRLGGPLSQARTPCRPLLLVHTYVPSFYQLRCGQVSLEIERGASNG